jgi:hypothetical protein
MAPIEQGENYTLSRWTWGIETREVALSFSKSIELVRRASLVLRIREAVGESNFLTSVGVLLAESQGGLGQLNRLHLSAFSPIKSISSSYA